MKNQEQLLRLLSDGQVHSGRSLADQLGVTRAAIWKQVRQLDKLGLDIEAHAGTGYTLSKPLELLQADKIRAGLDQPTRARIDELDLVWKLDSTSDFLLAKDPPEPGRTQICLAETQTGGRGRRGRAWQSPMGSGIWMSQSWSFAVAPTALGALSLAIGVAVLRALRASDLRHIDMKWPNDLVAEGGKLGGILIDIRGETDGPLNSVVGVGLNFDVSNRVVEAVLKQGGMPPVGLHQLATPTKVSRNAVAAQLINALSGAMAEFAAQGFSGFVDDWIAHDFLRDQQITVQVGDRALDGVARGIEPDGRLRIESHGAIESIMSGDVTLRKAS